MLIATLCHKWAAALTLGISFSKGEVEKKHAIAMVMIFSVSTPLGIVIGWILSNTSEILSGIFMAIAAGTFIYISAAEIVVEEFSVSKYKWLKFLFFLIGIFLIAGLWFTDTD